jgi:hypothetical protein
MPMAVSTSERIGPIRPIPERRLGLPDALTRPAAPRAAHGLFQGDTVLDTSPKLSADKARTLLRRLRDLNLSCGPVAITHRREVSLAGCLSLDAPAEKGVHYRVRSSDGNESLLEILWGPSGLELSAHDAHSATALRHMNIAVTCDRKGRACASALGARVQPESTDRRKLEHFLRRVVRTLFR